MDGNARGILRVPGEASEDEDGQEVEEEGKTKKKKKKKKKKKSAGETAPQPVKKSKESLTLDFSDLFMKIMVCDRYKFVRVKNIATCRPSSRVHIMSPCNLPLEGSGEQKTDLY